MNPMLTEFIGESRELLAQVGEVFLELERRPGNEDLLNQLFRAVHTIKGGSGLFDLGPFTKTVHAAEDLLDVIRARELVLNSDLVDTFFQAMDQVAAWLDNLNETESLPLDADEAGARLSEMLRTYLPARALDTQLEAKDTPPAPPSPATPDWLKHLPDHARLSLFRKAAAGDIPLLALTYLPDERCFFSGDDPLHTLRQTPELLWCHAEPVTPWPEPQAMDPYHCNLRLAAISEAPSEDLRELYRYVDQEVHLVQLSAASLVCPRGEAAEGEVFEQFLVDARELVQSGDFSRLAQMAELAVGIAGPEIFQGSALRWLLEVLAAPEPEPELAAALLDSMEQCRWPVLTIETEPGPVCAGDAHLGQADPGHPMYALFEAAREILRVQFQILDNPSDACAWLSMLPSCGAVMSRVFAALAWTDLQANLDEASGYEKEALKEALLNAAQQGMSRTHSAAGPASASNLSAMARELIEAQVEMLGIAGAAGIDRGRLESAGRVAGMVMQAMGRRDQMDEISRATDAAVLDVDSGALLACLDRQSRPDAWGDDDSGPDPLPLSAGADSAQAASGVSGEEPATPAPAGPGGNGNGDSGSTPRKQLTSLKVDVSRVDQLMSLVGELVVAKNALPFLARRAEDVFAVAKLSREIAVQYAVINRIAEELQGAVMQVRMLAVSHALQRFPRMVRDLARKQGKSIRLEIEGDDTEADKNIVEDLAEPLVHLVRNSIDHGIEAPEQRSRAGKPEEAVLRIAARNNNDRVEIVVSDDGAGIDPAKIKRMAYEKGVIGEEMLDCISDQDALQLIFAPGFSTAEKVSDLSGRGVGMDVVRSMVTSVGGTVHVESEPGRSTQVVLSLPLSMAITRVMMFQLAEETYGVPVNQIRETVRVSASRIHRIKNREALLLRGKLLPLLRMGQLLDSPGRKRDDKEEEYVLVVNVDGIEAGLVVDHFSEDVDVILKPLEGVVSGLKLFSGSALLGDGRVLLVLNLKELL